MQYRFPQSAERLVFIAAAYWAKKANNPNAFSPIQLKRGIWGEETQRRGEWDDRVSTQIVQSISLAYQNANVVYQEKSINDPLEGPQSGAEKLIYASKTT